MSVCCLFVHPLASRLGLAVALVGALTIIAPASWPLWPQTEEGGSASVSPPRFNVALAPLGGRVVSATSQYNDSSWAAANLIDSSPFFRVWGGEDWVCFKCGWSSADASLPQEIVFAFHQERAAQIASVVIDTTSWETSRMPDRLPREVEIWGSTTSPSEGFTKIAGTTLEQRAGERAIRFSPREIRFLKLVILSNYGGRYTQAGEVKIFEADPTGGSILHDFAIDLGQVRLGGTIARFSSQALEDDGSCGAYRLVDGVESSGWCADGSYLPQEIVFSFLEDREALIDHIVLHASDRDPSTWPRKGTVSLSSRNVLDGFEVVTEFDLELGWGRRAIPIGRRGRLLKLRILENFGGATTTLGQVKLIEGKGDGYRSVLLRAAGGAGADASGGVDAEGVSEEIDALPEVEPNDSPGQASALPVARFTRGTIDPPGDLDHFRLADPRSEGGEGSILNVEVIGQPNIRTSLTLSDLEGNVLKRFDPGAAPQRRLELSWAAGVGDRLLRVSEPPVSIVLIWDTSASMKEAAGDLELAVRSYLEQVRASESLSLVRFSDDVEVLLPRLTSDRRALLQASAGKFETIGGTALFDAIAEGIRLLDGVPGNRAIVVMTDGADSTSAIGRREFWQTLAEKRIRLYTIGLGIAMWDYNARNASSGGRVLRSLAEATNGRSYFAEESGELKDLYLRIADELHSRSTYFLRPRLSAGRGWVEVIASGERIQSVSAPSQVLLIFDGSNSMWGQIDGQAKIEIAKEVMAEVIAGLPSSLTVALRLYGHRASPGARDACSDSQLVVPFASVDKVALEAAIRAVQPRGTTPIAFSLEQVRRDFAEVEGEKTVILVTDGIEECGGDPAEVVERLLAEGLRIRVHTVGFALADEETKRQMRRVAELTGGRFYDASDSGGLKTALNESLEVAFDVRDTAGARVARGLVGRPQVAVPEGVYTIVVEASPDPVTVAEVVVASKELTTVALHKEGSEIGVRVARGPP